MSVGRPGPAQLLTCCNDAASALGATVNTKAAAVVTAYPLTGLLVTACICRDWATLVWIFCAHTGIKLHGTSTSRSYQVRAWEGCTILRAVAPQPSQATACLAAFERELDYLFWTLQRLGARPLDIEDLLQDMFAVLHQNWPTLDTTRPLRPWLFSVAFRLVRTYRRRQFRETLRDVLDPPDGSPDPEGRLQDRQSLTLLSAALERIPEPRRSVLVLHELDGVEVVEIARRLSITTFGVYARLRKGRKELASAVRSLGGRSVRP